MQVVVARFLLKWAWLVFVALALLEWAWLWLRVRRLGAEHPARACGYRRLAVVWLADRTAPWLAMGAGILFGRELTVLHFFHPELGRGPITAFYVVTALVWGGLTRWVLFGGGAEHVVAHPGFYRMRLRRPRTVKWLWAATVAFRIAAVAGLILYDPPLLALG